MGKGKDMGGFSRANGFWILKKFIMKDFLEDMMIIGGEGGGEI